MHLLNRNRKRVLSYHNVLSDEMLTNKPIDGVSHSLSSFESHLRYLTAHYSMGTDLNDPHQVTITFDDGYINQGLIALPVLQRYDVKAFFFYSLGLSSLQGTPLLIDDLLFWVSFVDAGNYRLEWPSKEEVLEVCISSEDSRATEWSKIYKLMLGRFYYLAPLLRDAMDCCVPYEKVKLNVSASYYKFRMTAMSEEQLAALVTLGHQVGAHAVSHGPLATMPRSQMEQEVKHCYNQVGKIFNSKVFSFPFGGTEEVSAGDAAYVMQCGFEQALANINKPLDAGASLQYNRYFIPRMHLPNTSSRLEIDFVFSGTKYFIQHFKLLPRW